jgi:homoaconitase/3-isopropylmalate dehydratase large subunit
MRHSHADRAAESDAHEHALSVDHAVFAEAGARLVLPAVRTLQAARAHVAFALMGGDPRRLPPASAPSSLAAESHAVARDLGIHVLRPASGRLDVIYLDHFAAPGRVVVSAGESVAAAGAIGSLALECGDLELAAVLAGAPRFVRDDAVLGIRFRGSPAPFVSGQDVAFEVARRLAPGGAEGRLVEFAGAGVASLSIHDRMIVAGTSAEWGAAAALFRNQRYGDGRETAASNGRHRPSVQRSSQGRNRSLYCIFGQPSIQNPR